MDTRYEKPVKKLHGSGYVFTPEIDPLFLYDHFCVSSKEQLEETQNAAIESAEHMVNLLEGYRLPEDTGGDASFRWRKYPAKLSKRRVVYYRTAGDIWLPDIVIESGLGMSHLFFHGWNKSNGHSTVGHKNQDTGNYISIYIAGKGIANEVLDITLKDIEKAFETRVTMEEKNSGEMKSIGEQTRRVDLPV